MRLLNVPDCKAVKIESDMFAPFVQEGQFVLFSENAKISEGDFVYLPLASREQAKFCQVIKKTGNAIAIASVARIDNPGTIQGEIGSNDLLFVHRVIGVLTYYAEK